MVLNTGSQRQCNLPQRRRTRMTKNPKRKCNLFHLWSGFPTRKTEIKRRTSSDCRCPWPIKAMRGFFAEPTHGHSAPAGFGHCFRSQFYMNPTDHTSTPSLFSRMPIGRQPGMVRNQYLHQLCCRMPCRSPRQEPVEGQTGEGPGDDLSNASQVCWQTDRPRYCDGAMTPGVMFDCAINIGVWLRRELRAHILHAPGFVSALTTSSLSYDLSASPG